MDGFKSLTKIHSNESWSWKLLWWSRCKLLHIRSMIMMMKLMMTDWNKAPLVAKERGRGRREELERLQCSNGKRGKASNFLDIPKIWFFKLAMVYFLNVNIYNYIIWILKPKNKISKYFGTTFGLITMIGFSSHPLFQNLRNIWPLFPIEMKRISTYNFKNGPT